MAERHGDDTSRNLEAACSDLIDIENITSNRELPDIHRKTSKENTEKSRLSSRHITERLATKGNNVCLDISARKLPLSCQRKSFCKFCEP